MPITLTAPKGMKDLRSGIRVTLYVIKHDVEKLVHGHSLWRYVFTEEGVDDVSARDRVIFRSPGADGCRSEVGLLGAKAIFPRQADDDPEIVESWI